MIDKLSGRRQNLITDVESPHGRKRRLATRFAVLALSMTTPAVAQAEAPNPVMRSAPASSEFSFASQPTSSPLPHLEMISSNYGLAVPENPAATAAQLSECASPESDAFACVRFLAENARVVTGNDETKWTYIPPDWIVRGMQKNCPPDDIDKVSLKQGKDKEFSITITGRDAEVTRLLAQPKAATGEPLPPGSGYSWDCDAVNTQTVRVQAEYLNSSKAKPRAFGKPAIMSAQKFLVISAPDSRPRPLFIEGKIKSNRRITSNDFKRGRVVLRVQNTSRPRPHNPSYGTTVAPSTGGHYLITAPKQTIHLKYDRPYRRFN